MPFLELPDSAALAQLVAAAADLCRKPLRHAVIERCDGSGSAGEAGGDDRWLTLEVRDNAGERHPERDLELEIYRSGSELNLMLSSTSEEQAPMLWHGSHAVWMQACTGERCERPVDGAPLEAFCRRVRALLGAVADGD